MTVVNIKKQKAKKKCVIKRNLKSKNFENCLEGSQVDNNKINYPEKKKLKQTVLKKIIRNS